MEDKTEFPQEVLIYFSSNNQKMELTSKCFPQQTVEPFYFLPRKRLSVMEEKHLRYLRSDGGSIKGRALFDKTRWPLYNYS